MCKQPPSAPLQPVSAKRNGVEISVSEKYKKVGEDIRRIVNLLHIGGMERGKLFATTLQLISGMAPPEADLELIENFDECVRLATGNRDRGSFAVCH